MKISTKVVIAAYALETVGLIYALLVPVGEASAWVLLPTALLSIPLIFHFAGIAFRPLPQAEPLPSHKVIVDGVDSKGFTHERLGKL